MHGVKRLAVMIFAGCFLLFSAIFISGSLYEKMKSLNGQIAMDKVSVSLKGNSGPKGGYFSLKDMEYLKKALATDVIAYAAQGNSLVSYGANSLETGVAGINELAPMFGNIGMLRGSFFSEADCREKSRVAVIDEDTAWKLFNNDDILGCNIDIFGSSFKIIGVAKSDRSIIGRLTANGSVKVYIPIQTYMDVSNGSGISYIQYDTGVEGVAGTNTAELTAALASMGKDPANYTLTDYNVRGKVMEQKPALLLFFMGLFIIAVLLYYAIAYAIKTVRAIRRECKTDYFSHAAAVYRSEILKTVLLLVFAGSASIIIWRLARFSAFISPDLVPDDFTDISYYIGLFLKKASASFSTDVYTVPFQEMKPNAAETVFNLVFYVGCFAGILFFYTGLAWLKRVKMELEKALLLCGGFLAADLGICALLALLAGLPFVVDLKGIILYWSFVLLNLTLFLPDAKETGLIRIKI